MNYRPDIDGLRAIAVIAVIVFHANLSFLGGGFLGVDVFFVISGYLITHISLNEIKNNKFSIFYFYEKRIRRLFPLLIFVLFTTIIFSYFLLLPYELKYYFQSLFATVSFSSNILFFLKSGYFDSSNAIKPLLHTWSLSLEEQFYLIFPIVLLIAVRLKKFIIIFGTIGIASFVTFIFPGMVESSFKFYMLPSRCWELILGTLLAYKHFYKIHLKILDNVSDLLGFLMVIFSFAFLDESFKYSEYVSVFPVIGTLFIINKTENSFLKNILSSKYLVSIGLLSYSLYLLHQPIFVFYRLIIGRPLSALESLYATLLTFIFSFFAFKLIEQRFRSINFRENKKSFFIIAVSFCFLAFLGFFGHLKDGFPNRTFSYRPDRFLSAFSSTSVEKSIMSKCSPSRAEICKINEGKNDNILLVGDSHAIDFLAQFDVFLKKNNHTGFISVMGGCSFLVESIDLNCKKINLEIRNVFKKIKFDKIIIIENYNSHLKAESLSQTEALKVFSNLIHHASSNNAKIYFFINRVSFLSSIETWGLSPLVDLNMLDNFEHEKILFQETFFNDLSKLNANIIFYDQKNFLCDLSFPKPCSPIEKTTLLPLYRDSNHLTPYGSKIVFDNFLKTLN